MKFTLMNKSYLYLVGSLVIFAFLSSAQAPASVVNDVVVICNKDVEDDILKQEDLKDIFLGKKTRWSNNDRIVFVVLRESGETEPIHRLFLKKCINRTPAQFNNYWKKVLFSGKGRIPRSFSSMEAMTEYISKTSGAIGYIQNEAIQEDIKVLTISK